MRQQGIEPRSTAWKATMLTITPLSLLTSYGQIFNGFLFANFYAPQWQWQALWFNVRMAEWSKAPDSRMWSFHHHSGWGLSGPHMWAWVRIPLLTHLFLTFLYIVYFIKKSHVRQRGIEPRSTAWKATMLTITPLTLLVFFSWKIWTNLREVITKVRHLSILLFTEAFNCHFQSFAYWCNCKNILTILKFYWHYSISEKIEIIWFCP